MLVHVGIKNETFIRRCLIQIGDRSIGELKYTSAAGPECLIEVKFKWLSNIGTGSVSPRNRMQLRRLRIRPSQFQR